MDFPYVELFKGWTIDSMLFNHKLSKSLINNSECIKRLFSYLKNYIYYVDFIAKLWYKILTLLVIKSEVITIISSKMHIFFLYAFTCECLFQACKSSRKYLFFPSCDYRSCWVCFATDEDDRTAEWVRPCRCRGSTKWVHQTCLQRWVDEKQRGNSTARVACPQCNAEYLIVFPKLGKIWII